MVPLNFVLTTLPVYALSFFKALSDIISSIESFLNNFFFLGPGGWGVVRIKEKYIGLVGILCLRKEYRGLGVRRL